MENGQKECGLRAKIDDLERIKETLIDMGTLFCGSTTQVDHYFKPKGQSDDLEAPGAVVIRVRDEIEKKSLNIKKMGTGGIWEEFSVSLNNASEMIKIFKALDFSEIFTVFKDRLFAQMNDFEINIDNIKGIGTYLEIEMKCIDVDASKKKIIDLFKKLGVKEKNIESKGYTKLISESRGYNVDVQG